MKLEKEKYKQKQIKSKVVELRIGNNNLHHIKTHHLWFFVQF